MYGAQGQLQPPLPLIPTWNATQQSISVYHCSRLHGMRIVMDGMSTITNTMHGPQFSRTKQSRSLGSSAVIMITYTSGVWRVRTPVVVRIKWSIIRCTLQLVRPHVHDMSSAELQQ